MSFIDVADVKARCTIEQATKSLGLKCTEEKNQLQAPIARDPGVPPYRILNFYLGSSRLPTNRPVT